MDKNITIGKQKLLYTRTSKLLGLVTLLIPIAPERGGNLIRLEEASVLIKNYFKISM
ncbi:MAG: hypothetical protein F7B11_05105 [Caldisphaeraceae archaeon]|nr:hypothetical protein [Caldisphaeraceae archaeon]